MGPGGLSLDLEILVVASPAEPFSWSATAVDSGDESQGMDGQGNIYCGHYFRLEIYALDKFNNR